MRQQTHFEAFFEKSRSEMRNETSRCEESLSEKYILKEKLRSFLALCSDFFIPAIPPVLSLEKWSRDSEQELSQASFAFYNIRVHVRKGEVVAFFRCLRNPFQLHSQNIHIRKKHGKGIAETRGIS